jgi:hypothetical protein
MSDRFRRSVLGSAFLCGGVIFVVCYIYYKTIFLLHVVCYNCDMKAVDDPQNAFLRERIVLSVQPISDSNGAEVPTGIAEFVSKRILRETQHG